MLIFSVQNQPTRIPKWKSVYCYLIVYIPTYLAVYFIKTKVCPQDNKKSCYSVSNIK